MDKKLRILHLEDSQVDAEIIQARLLKEGLECDITLVVTREDFTKAIERASFDVILADYSLPSFNGLSALMIAKEKCPDVPFILVSGALGEEMAVEILKKGATDYVLKGNLSRLVPTVHRALEEAQERAGRKKVQEELRFSEERYRSVVDNIGIGISLLSPNMEILALNKQMQTWFPHIDISSRPLCYKAFNDPPREEICSYCPSCKTLQDGQVHEDVTETPAKDKMIAFRLISSPVKDQDGKIIAVIEMVEDITERKRAEEALKASEDKFRSLFDQAADLIAILDLQGNFMDLNRRFEEESGWSREEMIGRNVLTSGIVTEESVRKISLYLSQLVQGKEIPMIEIEGARKEGGIVPYEIRATPIKKDDKTVAIQAILRNITERKQMEDKLKYLAYHDPLTGLPNRNLFLERINHEIAKAKDSSSSLAVVITDINKFKAIYDIYGSEVGDKVLKEVAERLSNAVRKGDTVAHLGNDEFGIAYTGLTGSDNIFMLEKILKEISYPLKIDGDEIILTFSTGISLYPHDGGNAFELLKSAGMALSIATQEGRKTYQFYSADMSVTASAMLLLEKQLMKAIKNEEFILHYQPYWDITTKKMVGMEALIRWQSKDNGLVPPGKFIPVLEETGMIIEVGEWILRTAMRQVKAWQDERYPVVPVSVNMSLIQFRQKDLTEMVKKVIRECGFYPSLLTLEITESAFMQDIEFTRSVLTAMKEIGCSVSIDDFGTGYSSLAYLKRFPVDNLKIDISFIREMVKDPDSASIVVAIINMAHTLNLKTIAEGIETEEQWNFLRLLRCDMGQGFYLSKPLPAEEFEKLFSGEDK